jgi:hypothetical protein
MNEKEEKSLSEAVSSFKELTAALFKWHKDFIRQNDEGVQLQVYVKRISGYLHDINESLSGQNVRLDSLTDAVSGLRDRLFKCQIKCDIEDPPQSGS